MKNIQHTFPKYDQRGFTLLEVMIAMVIFSIGMLGLAGLQARGLQSNTTAQYRTIATIQAYDMADRIRANARGITDGDYDAIGTNIPAAVNCISGTCTAAQMAQFDHFEWNTTNGNVMPSGRGSVDIVVGTGRFTITMMWDEDRTGIFGEGCSTDPTVDLKCYTLVFEP